MIFDDAASDDAVLNLIDDDEWLELGLLVQGAVRRLPAGSILVEAVQMPPFRLAISATGSELDGVVTRPTVPGLRTADEVVRAAVALAETERPDVPGALSIAVTQSADGVHYAVAVVGLPGERSSFMTFGLPPGGHSIDVGEMSLALLEGWAIRRVEPYGPTNDRRAA